MDLAGTILIERPPHEVLAALRDPAMLSALLPQGTELHSSAQGQFDFTFTRKVGPISLAMPVSLTLSPRGAGFGQTLRANAAHLLAGRVALDMALDLMPQLLATRLDWSGKLTGAGMVGRMIEENAERIEGSALSVMTRLKAWIEAPRAARAAKATLRTAR